MEFTNGRCTKCQKDIQIPADLAEINCIYCGHHMAAGEAVDALAQSQDGGEGSFGSLDLEAFGKIMESEVPFNKIFNKQAYKDTFDALVMRYEPYLEALSHHYVYCPGPKDKYIQDVADHLVSMEKDKIEGLKTGQQKSILQTDSAYVALFVVPVIGHYQSEAASKLADALVYSWRNSFAEYQIKRGDFESINSGFKKKLCYITTAVCDSLGHQNDDCYELTTLRAFRDNWLVQQKDGLALTEEYYDKAPAIVQMIDHSCEAGRVYNDLYARYINPCVRMIENEDYDGCKAHYIRMIKTLEKDFLH